MVELPDYLVSFCLAQEGDLTLELDAISALAASCDQRLAYWEIVYVTGESYRSAIQAAIDKFATIESLRIVLVRDAVRYYRRRTIAASAAIGDVVVLTSFTEMAKADLLTFAEEAMASNCVVIGHRAGKVLPRVSHWLLGLISRYRVDGRDLKTIALPRNHLVAILDRPTAPIDLRFEPKRGVVPYLRKELWLTGAGGKADLKQRLELLAEIISTSAARFLVTFALASGIVSAMAASYGVYAVGVITLRDDVQPGWFSTTIALSGSAAFLSIGLAIIALGIAHILDRMDGAARHEIIDELGNISFCVRDLNVEIGSEMVKVDAK